MATDSEPPLARRAASQTPMLFFALTVASIFSAETALMVVLSLCPPLPFWLTVLIDSLLLTALLCPVLYYFTFRPMTSQMAELFRAQEHLGHEIAERREAEAALRQSERQLQYLSSRLMSVQEEERRRVARELHEELAQSLAALKLQLRLIDKTLTADQHEAGEECKQGLRRIDDMITEIRGLSRDLSPAILEDLGLSAAVRRLIAHSAGGSDIESLLETGDIDRRFPSKDQILVYRILQEALSNIKLHSGATRQSVRIQTGPDGAFSMVVEDNGRGFDVTELEHAQDGSGLGLRTMHERARILGGNLQIRSEQGKGTQVALIVPAKKTAV